MNEHLRSFYGFISEVRICTGKYKMAWIRKCSSTFQVNNVLWFIRDSTYFMKVPVQQGLLLNSVLQYNLSLWTTDKSNCDIQATSHSSFTFTYQILMSHPTIHLRQISPENHQKNICILFPKLFLPTMRKYCSLLKFEAEGQEFSKILRSLEQFIQTVKGQNNFW